MDDLLERHEAATAGERHEAWDVARKLDGRDVDAQGNPILPRSGIAFETQHLADSPNKPHFPSTRLDPGEAYRAVTVWDFGVAAR